MEREEFKGTKGPWEVVDDYHKYEDGPQIYIWNGDEQAHKSICDMGEMGDMNYAEEIANAQLIAAAPELLEACLKMVNAVPISDQNYSAYKYAKQAITKALGK